MKSKIILIEDAQDKAKSVLRQKTARIKFPLSQEDKDLISDLKKLLVSINGVGLAAPQINVNKNIAAIHIAEKASLLRDNAISYPMHIIINAHYQPVESDGIYSDFEGCFSVKSVYGKVPRYNSIKVSYQTEDGVKITRIEKGFYARVLQHEIDHLHGLLITDRLSKDCLQGSFEEMVKHRRESLSDEKKLIFDEFLKKRVLSSSAEERE